jgi:hypothetical protein
MLRSAPRRPLEEGGIPDGAVDGPYRTGPRGPDSYLDVADGVFPLEDNDPGPSTTPLEDEFRASTAAGKTPLG